MNKGFTISEVMIALSLSLVILSIVLSYLTQTGNHSKKVIGHQQKMESIIHTITMLKADLTNCGMRLKEAAKLFSLSLFEYTTDSFKVTYGIEDESLITDAVVGETIININRNSYFSSGKKILIFEPLTCMYEINTIKKVKGNVVTLDAELKNNYSTFANAVALKEVEYKWYQTKDSCSLKRKVNKGYFQPILENVTDFYVHYYPEANSVLYRVEVGRKEQIRGYIFLTHLPEVEIEKPTI